MEAWIMTIVGIKYTRIVYYNRNEPIQGRFRKQMIM